MPCKNITISDDGTIVSVHFIDTTIATYDRRSEIMTLCHGGFKTDRVKYQMNAFAINLNLPVIVWRRKKDWFVTFSHNKHTNTVKFVGDTLHFRCNGNRMEG